MIDEVKADAENKMKKTIDALKRELASIRTGRASPALLEPLKVEFYGVPTPLQQIAAVAAPEARLLTIKPYDPSTLSAIEKAILKSDLGITPMNDGKIIRLSIPALTEERRRDLIKVVHREAENARIAVRNIRRDANNHLKDLLKQKKVAEDEERRAQDEVQKLTDRYISEVDKALAAKEADLIAV